MGRVKTQRTKTDVECSHTAISQATSHSMHHSRADTRKCSTERGDKNYEKTIQMTSMEEWDRTTQFFYIILFFFFLHYSYKRELQAMEHHKSGVEVLGLRVHPVAKS